MKMFKTCSIIALLILLSCGKSPFTSIEENEAPNIRGISPGQASELAFSNEKIKIHPYWKESCVLYEGCKMLVVLTDLQDHPINDSYDLGAKLWMSSGMDTPHGSFPIRSKKIAPGIFELTEIFFIMEGLWEFHFQLLKADKIIETYLWPQQF